jgi:hypothetical protein
MRSLKKYKKLGILIGLMVAISFQVVSIINYDTKHTAVRLCTKYPYPQGSYGCPDDVSGGPIDLFADEFDMHFAPKHFLLSDMAFREAMYPYGFSLGTMPIMESIANCGDDSANNYTCVFDSRYIVQHYHKRVSIVFVLWVIVMTLLLERVILIMYRYLKNRRHHESSSKRPSSSRS